MKKLLTVLSLLATAVICTACGDRMNDSSDSVSYYEQYDYGNGNYDTSDDDMHDDFSDIGDGVRDAVDDVKDAGEDIITDVSSAVSDIFDNDRTSDFNNSDTTTTVTATTE